ncbi:MAG: RNA polymerase factor sigma-54 [Parachlamydiales bacterium]|nr:RNA polymerase factor sigma-54 [Parachlamydiales bacterium]
MERRPLLNLAPERRMNMTLALRQALEILQMPQMELAAWLLNEIEKNPLLEMQSSKLKRPFVGEFPAPVTLHEHIEGQIRDHFSDPKIRKMASELMHQLDERGFLPEETKNGEVLDILQTFDPPGLFARSIRECLLLQLKARGQENTLPYALIQKCYEDLLYGRYALIRKKLKTDDIKSAIMDISRLSLRPASQFKQEPSTAISIDLYIKKIDGGWTLELVEEDLPRFHIQAEYCELETESDEERESLRNFKTRAKWICRSLNRRRKMLQEIGRLIVKKQSRFLDQKGPLAPLSMNELAAKLQIHESTLSRALHGKYAATPRGILSLRSLISTDPESENAKQTLKKLIASEDKKYPLTDDQLAKALKEKGFPIARRTIAKYRNKLKIGSASQRKNL